MCNIRSMAPNQGLESDAPSSQARVSGSALHHIKR